MRRGFRFNLIFCLLFLSGVAGCVRAEVPAAPQQNPAATGRLSVGFDLDDTLLFSTPAFDKGFKNVDAAFSRRFWILVNKSDRHNSVVKPTAAAILDKHRKSGDDIYIITARRPYGIEPLLGYLEETFHIPADHVYFEPEGKKKRIRTLKLDIFYGDSDSDISAAIDAGAKGIRILRAPDSWYKKKYHPGKYREPVIEHSEM